MSGPHNMLPPLGNGMASSSPSHLSPLTNLANGQNHNSNVAPVLQQPPPGMSTSARPPPPPLDTMRAYRACLHCRNRKSKCDLESNQGRPPCRRCQRENKECILGESHRGGRRVRKKPKLEEETSKDVSPSTPSQQSFQSSSAGPSPQYDPRLTQPPPLLEPFNQFNNQAMWQQPPPATGPDNANISRQLDYAHMANATNNPAYRSRMDSTVSLPGKPSHEGIASADLQNPSDALEILAQVADRADDSNSPRSDGPSGQKPKRQPQQRVDPNPPQMEQTWHYKPIQDGLMSPEMVYSLFACYEQFFHPFFPIIPRETFDRSRFQWLSRHEPHLFSAILTVASKDNDRIHQVCYEHMQQLISMILAGADANVEAVEALLLLSQWVSHRPQVASTVGRGEEDRVAWMYIGTALRLGYYLEIDRTSFNSDVQEDPVKYNRKRLVWAACYICDRQVSVRVGKGFWARGPGPLSGSRANNFPTLQRMAPHDEDYATIFQANLELTQIFSNVHDILYSSKGHAWKEMLEGRYAKYLDDFRFSIRTWMNTWEHLSCPPHIKASLLLTYDYLRLYVNAFAYQATISRALTDQRDSQHNPNRTVPLINATAADARFIYEAIDAATSLLARFNESVDPQTLRYMPSSYYLFVIYSAVFLYKARSTTSMKEDEREAVRSTIKQTIDRLQQSSVGANQIGTRYARLLELLWRKSPKRNGNSSLHRQSIDNRLAQKSDIPTDPSTQNTHLPYDPTVNTYSMPQGGYLPAPDQFVMADQGNGAAFSWLDLAGTWNFATQNGNASSSGSADEGNLGGVDMSPFDGGTYMEPNFLNVEMGNGGLMF